MTVKTSIKHWKYHCLISNLLTPSMLTFPGKKNKHMIQSYRKWKLRIWRSMYNALHTIFGDLTNTAFTLQNLFSGMTIIQSAFCAFMPPIPGEGQLAFSALPLHPPHWWRLAALSGNTSLQLSQIIRGSTQLPVLPYIKSSTPHGLLSWAHSIHSSMCMKFIWYLQPPQSLIFLLKVLQH